MLQPIKCIFWEKWVWSFKTLSSTFYAKWRSVTRKNTLAALNPHISSFSLFPPLHPVHFYRVDIFIPVAHIRIDNILLTKSFLFVIDGLLTIFSPKFLASLEWSYYHPIKHLLVFKTSWRLLQDMSWKPLQHVFSVTSFRLPRRLEDILGDEKLLRWRRFQDVLKICLEDVLKTSWRQAKCLLGISVCNKSKYVSNESIFHKSISDESKANPECIN